MPRKHRKWTRAEIEEIADLRDSGLTYRKIALRMRATKSQIIGVAYHRGMCKPRRTRDQTGREVNRLCKQGMSLSEAANDLGISYNYAACAASDVAL